MPRIIKEKLRHHIVLVDTNILWCKDKGPAVNPEFSETWDSLRRDFPLRLAVPYVVRGELLFQQTTSCHKIVDKISDDTKEVAGITDHPHKARITKSDVSTQVSRKLDRWLKQNDVTVVPIPTASIHWQKMCDAAIWRLPPFTFDAKTPDVEKGFRDALIFETVIDFVTQNTADVDIAFICNDFLLRTTVDKALHRYKHFKSFEDLGGFGSYLKLQREELNSAFIARIVRRANLKFYQKNNPECLWAREKLWAKLLSTIREVSEAPENEVGLMTTGIAALSKSQQLAIGGGSNWTQVEAPIVRLSSPEFQSLSGERTYHWRTEIDYRQRYQSQNSFNALFKTVPEVKVKAVRFHVFWSADVKADARFHSVALEKIDAVSTKFRSLTPADQSIFGITPTTETAQSELSASP